MKIAVIAACPFPWPRGTPIRIFRIAESLAERGHNVHVLTYHLGEDIESNFTIHRIPPVSGYNKTSPGPSVSKLLKLNPALKRLTRSVHRKERFDIALAVHYEGMLVAASSLSDIPIVYDAHTTLAGELADYFPHAFRPIFRWIGTCLDRFVPAKADHIISVSDSIAHSLVQNNAVHSDQINVIPNGVRFDLFSQSTAPPDLKTIIFTGNDAPYQRIDLLVTAFVIANREDPSLRLKIVGNATFADVKETINRLELSHAIELLQIPFAEQINHLARSAIAVTPRTQCDGLPQKLLNSRAAGKAILACQGSAGPIAHDVNGIVVPNDDPQALANEMLRLANDPCLTKRLGDAARALAKSEYSWQTTALRIETVFGKLLSRTTEQPTSP